jgi:hypothetical protein
MLAALPVRSLVILALGAALTACSPAESTADAEASAKQDPPGAALPLSIGGRAAAEGAGLYETAINCAAAIEITSERLAQMASNPNSNEINLLDRAKDHFEEQAGKAQADNSEIAGSPAAAIARRRTEKADATKEQAQLAIACLRRFGDDVG